MSTMNALQEFADLHGLVLSIEELKHNTQPEMRYYATFFGAWVLAGCEELGVCGNGYSPYEAVTDYARRIAGETLLVRVGGSEFRIKVPIDLHCSATKTPGMATSATIPAAISSPIIKVRLLTPTAALPKYQTDGAAGMDLCADEDGDLRPNQRRMIKTGIAIEIPPGFEGQIRPRSGLAGTHGVTVLNSPGTIDSDYRGEVKIILINHGLGRWMYSRGDRVAQLVITPVAHAELLAVEALDETARGSGGFGSTG
jgi:dUTP pyrophosphatase